MFEPVLDVVSMFLFFINFQTGSNCDGGFFQFHGTESDAEDRWCGFAFNSNEAATTGGTQYGNKSFGNQECDKNVKEFQLELYSRVYLIL